MSAEPSEEMDRKIYAMIPGHEDADSEDSAMESLSEEDQEALRLAESYRSGEKRKKRKNPEQKEDITGSGSQLRQQYWCL